MIPINHESCRVVLFYPPEIQALVFQCLDNVGARNRNEIRGVTYFRPSVESTPAKGTPTFLSQEVECQLSADIDSRMLSELQRKISFIHPYETFSLEVYSKKSDEEKHDDTQVKMKILTNEPEMAMKTFSNLGAGKIGQYSDCFFVYENENSTYSHTVETLCARSLFGQGELQKKTLKINGWPVSFELLKVNPTLHGNVMRRL